MLQEFTDKRKAARNHLSEVGGKFSWALATDEEKQAGLGLHTINNASESVFGGLTEAITKSSMISLSHAGAMSQSRCNGDFTRILLCAKKKKIDQGVLINILQICSSVEIENSSPLTFSGNFCQMPIKLCNLFLVLSKAMRCHKARKDMLRLKERHAKKIKKD